MTNKELVGCFCWWHEGERWFCFLSGVGGSTTYLFFILCGLKLDDGNSGVFTNSIFLYTVC